MVLICLFITQNIDSQMAFLKFFLAEEASIHLSLRSNGLNPFSYYESFICVLVGFSSNYQYA